MHINNNLALRFYHISGAVSFIHNAVFALEDFVTRDSLVAACAHGSAKITIVLTIIANVLCKLRSNDVVKWPVRKITICDTIRVLL